MLDPKDPQIISKLLSTIEEYPERPGLKDTPSRVIRSYDEIFSGYGKDPKGAFTVFESGGYDSIVVLKCEFYSMCEHHMLPFFGKVTVAYLPGINKTIVGISKLSRLVDIFARRLQVQERICEQVTNAMMEHLQPAGAACKIVASHMCMRMRGVNKQSAKMTTLVMKGVFLEDAMARQELMNLMK